MPCCPGERGPRERGPGEMSWKECPGEKSYWRDRSLCGVEREVPLCGESSPGPSPGVESGPTGVLVRMGVRSA